MTRKRPYRLLVIDDEAMILQVLEEGLTMAGYEVRCAGHGKSAMELLERESFDLIVSDIIMPEMDGLELVRALKKRGNSLPVLAMTGGSAHLSPANLLRIAELFSATRTIMKPFTLVQLLAVVREILPEECTPSGER